MRLGSLGGLIGASVNEFSTDGTLAQNSDSKVPTQSAVKTYVDNISSISGNLTITGNLQVDGTTTTVNTTNTTISDKLLELGTGTSGSPSGDAGIVIERGSSDNIFIGWDESEDKIRFATGAFTGASGGDLTLSDAIVAFGNIEAGRLTTNEVIERADVKGDTLTGTPNVNLEDNAVHYYTSNARANWVFNFRGGVSTTLNSMLATGEVMTVALLTTQGSTAYYATGIQIDGVSQTVKWSNGTAPSSGTASSIEVYSFSIVKTGNATYSVIGSVSDYS